MPQRPGGFSYQRPGQRPLVRSALVGPAARFAGPRPSAPPPVELPPVSRTITLAEGMTVKDLADKLDVRVKDVLKALLDRRMMMTINSTIDIDTAREVSRQFGADVQTRSFEEELIEVESEAVDVKDQVARAPVVTVMGHVDHGKTTLLDSIRTTRVAEREAGGITQHIGAYLVPVGEKGDKHIVFLDTPGHEAFTLMRARGSKVTDVVVLVVAADDGVMPQTQRSHRSRARRERAAHRGGQQDRQAGRQPGDREAAARRPQPRPRGVGRLDRLRRGLGQEEAGPRPAARDDSARHRHRRAQGQSRSGRRSAPCSRPSSIAAAARWPPSSCRTARCASATTSSPGRSSAACARSSTTAAARSRLPGPSTPVEVLGLETLPSPGDSFQSVADPAKARQIATFRQAQAKERALGAKGGRLTLESLQAELAKGDVKELPIIIKADVQGSAEVLASTLAKLSDDKTKIKIIHSAVGAINESDVLLAAASNAIIIGFNVRPDRNAADVADREKVDIRLHSVIYNVTDEIKKAMAGLLDPTFKEQRLGSAVVRETFKVPKVGTIAGCMVQDGRITRSGDAQARLLRDNVVVWEGKLASLRRFKDDVSEVKAGFECGIGLQNFNDVKVGDVIEVFTMERVAAAV